MVSILVERSLVASRIGRFVEMYSTGNEKSWKGSGGSGRRAPRRHRRRRHFRRRPQDDRDQSRRQTGWDWVGHLDTWF